MAVLLIPEEQSLLEKVTDRKLRLCLDTLRQAIESLWPSNAPLIVQDFTDHGIAHYERIAGYVANILTARSPQTEPLSATEMFLLIGGIYLHDVGMQCDVTTEDGEQIRKRAETIGEREETIGEAAETIGAHFDTEFTATAATRYSLDEQKSIRKNHQFLSAAWIEYAHETGKTALGPAARQIPFELVPDLMDVCLHHTSISIEKCKRSLKGGGSGRKQMVAAMLRFADELDIDANRVEMTAVTDFSANPENAMFWWLHNLTGVTFVPPNIFRTTVRLRASDYEEFAPLVKSVYLERFRMKNQETLGVLRDHGYPVFLDAAGDVISLRTAPALPDEIRRALNTLAGVSISTQPPSIEPTISERLVTQAPVEQTNVLPPVISPQLVLPKPSSFFTGRTKVLDEVAAALAEHATVALSGIGGLGKTQVTLQYAALHGKEYDHVFFVNADTGSTLQTSYAEIASQLNLLPQEVSDLTLIATTVLRWLGNTPGWLLIADNADNLKVVRDLLPFQGKGRLLLTTREAVLGGLGHLIRLPSLSEEEGASLLLRRAQVMRLTETLDDINTDVREDACKLSRELGGLPLALEQAGSYLEEMTLSPREYLALYKENAAALLAHESYNSLEGHTPVWITFKVAFDKIEQRSPATADLLRFCSLLAPDPIPEEIFLNGAEYLGETLKPFLPLRLHELTRVAGSFSLLTRDAHNKNLLMHSVVQHVIWNGLDAVTSGHLVDCAIHALGANLPKPDFANWPLYERLLPHLLVCAGYIERKKLVTEEAAYLLCRTGWYLEDRTQYIPVEPLLNRAIAIYEKVLGPEHPDTAMALNNLAFLYNTTNRQTQAELMYERALAIREKVLGPEHPGTATALNNLAWFHHNRGSYGKAGPLFKRLLAIHRRKFGDKNTKTKYICHQYVMCLRKQGNWTQAREAEKRC